MTEKRTLPQPDKFASCPYDGKILSYYAGFFEAVFIILPPFLRPETDKLDCFELDPNDNYPSDRQGKLRRILYLLAAKNTN